MVIIGGMGNVWGAIVGAFVIEGLNFYLLPSLTDWGHAIGLDVDFSSWNMLIFGVLLVVMMLYRPQGFVPGKARKLVFADDGHHYPAGMQGADGDVAHAVAAPHPEVVPAAEVEATPDPSPTPQLPVAQQPQGGRFRRFESGSNPFGAPA
jgi:hypothetical protein